MNNQLISKVISQNIVVELDLGKFLVSILLAHVEVLKRTFHPAKRVTNSSHCAIKVVRIDLLLTLNICCKFDAVEIFRSGPEHWTHRARGML